MATALHYHHLAPITGLSLRRPQRRFRSHGIDRPASPTAKEEDNKVKKSPSPSSPTENAVLRLAWYGSELLGIAASILRPPAQRSQLWSEVKSAGDNLEYVERTLVVDAIKTDFGLSYFVTGNLTTSVYNDDCEFADPAGSFRGLQRFKRNCSNFGSLLVKSNMKLTKWEDFQDKGVGHWKFSCVMSFPWRPILSATGYTEYYFDSRTGRVCRHVEHWNVPKIALLRQIFRPSRWVWEKR